MRDYPNNQSDLEEIRFAGHEERVNLSRLAPKLLANFSTDLIREKKKSNFSVGLERKQNFTRRKELIKFCIYKKILN